MTNKHIGSNFDDFLKEEGIIMTTDIEKQFFEAFGIKPKLDNRKCKCGCKDCKNCFKAQYFYPEITDRHYLAILTRYGNISHYETMTDLTLEEIKELILKDFLAAVDSVDCITRYQVEQYIKTLFKEG